MKTKLVIVLSFLIASSVYAGSAEVFSDYSGNLRVKEISYFEPLVKFKGAVEVSGTLVFRLDVLGDGQYGAPIFADFIPIESEMLFFPQVISGRYPRKLEQIGIINITEAFEKAGQDKLIHNTREVRVYGSVVIKEYSTTIECDARQYFATLTSFSLTGSVAMINPKDVSGC